MTEDDNPFVHYSTEDLRVPMFHLLIIADDESGYQSICNQPVNVLVSCGDIPDQAILDVARRTDCPHIMAVKGNHDSGGDFPAPIVDLHLRVQTILGVRFGGFRGSWRYKPRGNHLYDQSEVRELLASFPPVDIFVTHNSPRHVHDRDDDVHLGFEAFHEYIERHQPRFLIHGHQHVNRETSIGATRVIGVYGYLSLEYS